MSDNLDLNMNNETCCSQLSKYLKKNTWHLGKEMNHFSVKGKLDNFFKPAL
jgi:hypothetical protein